jgi:hypothetical protein
MKELTKTDARFLSVLELVVAEYNKIEGKINTDAIAKRINYATTLNELWSIQRTIQSYADSLQWARAMRK